MSSCLQSIQLACAFCRIVFCSACGRRRPKQPMESYDIICIGLTGAGKTSLLCLLSRQTTDDIVPTTGFMIKACPVEECILNIKEIGGASEMRQYWKHYYKACQAVVFVVDSASSDEKLATAAGALGDAVKHPDLKDVPCLVIANCQDKPGARDENQLREILHLERIFSGRTWSLCLCSKDNFDAVSCGFSTLVSFLKPPQNVVC